MRRAGLYPGFLPAQSPLYLYPVSISCFSRDRGPLISESVTEGARTMVIPATLSAAERKKTTASPLPGGLPQKPLEHLVRQQPSARSKSGKPSLPRHESRGHHLIHNTCRRLQTAALFSDGLQVDPARQPQTQKERLFQR